VVHAGAYFLKEQVRVEGAAKVFTRAGTSADVRFHLCPE
jgi:hypothetical protein